MKLEMKKWLVCLYIVTDHSNNYQTFDMSWQFSMIVEADCSDTAKELFKKDINDNERYLSIKHEYEYAFKEEIFSHLLDNMKIIKNLKEN